MLGENKERWKVLCEQAATEQEPEKLHQLVREINDLLEAKEARLEGRPPKA
jgi:predicted Zn-ribbon and HTH transcriptional regulator